MARIELLQKIANLLVYVYFVTTTGYYLLSKDRIADVFAGYQTYFDPARWIFVLWPVIHLFLGAFIIYQWFDPAHDAAINGVGWHFIIAALLNSLWLSLLENHHSILAFLVSLLLVASVSIIFYNLEKDYPSQSWADKLFMHAPFSLWHGFTVFLAVVNAFVAFTKVRKDVTDAILPPNVFHLILVYIALVFLTLTSIGYVQYKHDRGDLTSAWVIALGLWAVFDQQPFAAIHWPTLAAALLTTLYPFKPYIYRLLGIQTTGTETTPLLST